MEQGDLREPVLPDPGQTPARLGGRGPVWARPGSPAYQQAGGSRDWTLKALREAGNSLLSELHGLDEGYLRRRPSEGEWSLKEIAAHLRDAEELALAQIDAFVSNPSTPLPAWDVDLFPQERDYQSEEITGLLASFRGGRRRTMQMLWGLSTADWGRSAEHPYRGKVTLGEMARELAQHDLEHLWQVRRLKVTLRRGSG